MATSNYCRQTSVPHIEEVPLIGGAAVPGPAVLDAPICGVEFFYVLYISETCKIWDLAAAEQQQ